MHIDDKFLKSVHAGAARELPADRLRRAAGDETASRSQGLRNRSTGRRHGPLRRDDGRCTSIPNSHTGMLVSFPRDLIVQIPGHGLNLLNAAYAFGGPALTIQTIEQDFQRPADQPLPRGRLPWLQEHRRRHRPREHLLPHAGARPVHRALGEPGRLCQPRRRSGARVRAVAALQHPRESAESGAVESVVGHAALGGLDRGPARRPRPHPAPAVLPAHDQSGRDRTRPAATPPRSWRCSAACSVTSRTTRT